MIAPGTPITQPGHPVPSPISSSAVWYGVYHCLSPCMCAIQQFIVRPDVVKGTPVCPPTFGLAGCTAHLIFCSMDQHAAQMALQRCMHTWCSQPGMR